MRGKEHLAFGIATSMTVALAAYDPSSAYFAHPLLFTAMGALGSVIPDIDHPDSLISQKLQLISNIITLFVNHRTYTHDIALVLPLAIYLTMQCPLVFAGFFFGYLGHLFLDLLTVQGLPFLYLFNKKNIHITPKWARFKASSGVAVFVTYLGIIGTLAAGYYLTDGAVVQTLLNLL